MFGLSFEHLLIVFVVLLIFGPKRLPEIGRSAGKGIKKMKDAWEGVKEPTYKHLGDDK